MRIAVHPEYESPEVTVQFKGPDVDLLLANKAELLLALEQVTMEALTYAVGGSFAALIRRQRLPHAAHRGAAFERLGRGRKGQAHRLAILLQSDEQPGAARHPHGAARRDGTAQRKHGLWKPSAGGGVSGGNAECSDCPLRLRRRGETAMEIGIATVTDAPIGLHGHSAEAPADKHPATRSSRSPRHPDEAA